MATEHNKQQPTIPACKPRATPRRRATRGDDDQPLFCRHCGGALPQLMEYCPRCGKAWRDTSGKRE